MQLLQCKLIKKLSNFVEIVQIQVYMYKFVFTYILTLENYMITT